MTRIEKAVAELRRRNGTFRPKYAPRKRTGVIKNVTITEAGDHVIKLGRLLYGMTMSETVDAALKEWARIHKVDDELAKRTSEALYPGAGHVARAGD